MFSDQVKRVPDDRQIMRTAVVDGPSLPSIGAVPTLPVPNGPLSGADRDHEPGIALIDAVPLRRASALQLLRTHFQGAQQFVSATEFLTNASTSGDTPSVVVVCVGGRSVDDR